MTLPPLALFPATASAVGGRLALGGVDAGRLADEHGTPLYVYDENTLAERARAYVEPFRAATGGRCRVVFASKACPVPGVMRVLRAQGMGIDVASAGEVAAARAAGFTGAEMVVHGNAKSPADVDAALDADAALIVVDAVDDAALVAEHASRRGRVQDVLLRVNPDVAVDTHEKIRTGHAASKFGLAPDVAADLIAALPAGLRLRGVHVHLGSQVLDAVPLVEMAGWIADFVVAAAPGTDVVDVGGGVGVRYTDGERAPDIRRFAVDVARGAAAAFRSHGLEVPELVLEPGRSVVAQAGVTLYRVRSVKTTADGSTYVAVDGGMADNPRVSLYGGVYHPVLATRLDDPPTGRFSIAGRHCEEGDQLAHDVPLPAPTVGDVIAVPMTGAYHQAMATTYNLFARPAAVLVRDGAARVITRRETVEDLLARELP